MTSRPALPGLLPLIVQACALFPVWVWIGRRLCHQSGDSLWVLPAGAIPLVIRAAIRSEDTPSERSLTVPAVLTLVYAAAYPFTPPLVQAALGMTACCSTVSVLFFRTPLHLPTLGLILLALPVLPSLEFFGGYPLSRVAGFIAVGLLRLFGASVGLDGTCILWGSRVIAVDAPCSGVKMLWGGVFLAVAVSGLGGLSNLRTATLVAAATAIIILANGLRSASLFLLEARIIEAPMWFHGAVGIVVFCMAGASILGLYTRLEGKRR